MGNLELHLIKGIPVVHSGDDLIVGHISIETHDIDRVPAILEAKGVSYRQKCVRAQGCHGQGERDERLALQRRDSEAVFPPRPRRLIPGDLQLRRPHPVLPRKEGLPCWLQRGRDAPQHPAKIIPSPFLRARLTSIPGATSNNSTTEACPLQDAKWRGVLPHLPLRFTSTPQRNQLGIESHYQGIERARSARERLCGPRGVERGPVSRHKPCRGLRP